MADIEKNIKINVETQEATQNIESLNEELKKTDKVAEATSEKLNESADALAKTSSEAKKANPSLSEIWSNFKSGITHARSLKEAVNLVGTSFKALLANPIGIALAAVAAVVKGLTDAFKRNDDASTSLQRALTVLKAPLKVIQRVFDGLAWVIGKVAEGFANATVAVSNFATKALGKIGIHIDNVIGKNDDLVQSLDRLEDKEREYAKEVAESEAEIAQLRADAVDDSLTYEARKKALSRAEELEYKNLEAARKIAEEKIRLAKLEAELNKDTSDETKNKINELEVALVNITTRGEEIRRQYLRENKRLDNQEDTRRKQAWQEQQRRIKQQHDEEERLEKEHLKHLEDLRREHNENLKAIDAERLNYLKNEEAANNSLVNSLAVLSEEYIQEQEEITKRMNEEAVNRAQYQKELLTATTQEEKDRLHGLIDSSDELTQQLGANLEQSTRLFQGNVTNLINTVSGAFEDFQIDTTKTKQENLDAIQQTYDAAMQQIKEAHEEGRITDEEYAKAQQDLYAGMTANVIQANNIAFEETVKKIIDGSNEQIEAYKQSTSTLMDAAASVFGDIANLYANEYQKIMASGDELTESQRKQAVEALEKQKAASIIQFALQQAMAIGNAVIAATSAAASAGPAAAIVYAATFASMLAGIISSFVSLKSNLAGIDQQIAELKAPKKLATGGYVSGPGTATSDSIPARLSNGEAVINARSTAMFYDELSRINQAGGGVAFPGTSTWKFSSGGVAMDMGMMVRAMKEAVSEIQPVVSVKEITNTQKRIAMKENR